MCTGQGRSGSSLVGPDPHGMEGLVNYQPRSQSHGQIFVACSRVKRGGPGTFPHVSDVKGRKTVARPK